MITFNICTITCAVASYVHYMGSFDMCRHSCAKFVIWLQMPFIVLEFFTLLLVLHIQHAVLVSGLRRFQHSLFIFSRNCLTVTHVVRRLITSIRANLDQGNYCVSENGLIVTSCFATG